MLYYVIGYITQSQVDISSCSEVSWYCILISVLTLTSHINDSNLFGIWQHTFTALNCFSLASRLTVVSCVSKKTAHKTLPRDYLHIAKPHKNGESKLTLPLSQVICTLAIIYTHKTLFRDTCTQFYLHKHLHWTAILYMHTLSYHIIICLYWIQIIIAEIISN